MDTELENLRTLSLLSGRPQEIQHQGRTYVAYAGYLLTYSTFCTIFMWTIAGPKIYHSIWRDRAGAIEESRALNPQDERLATLHDDNVGQYISDQFRIAMQPIRPEEIEEIISGMFYFRGS